MTDRFITVPDSLELPAAVKVPVARLVGPTGAAATPADLGAATAAQGELADTAVQPGDLGNAAGLDVGTTAGTVLAGDDSRVTSLPSTYVAHIGPGTADDTSQLQTLLDAGGTVRGMPDETYTITATLIIGSDTTLDMTGCTVQWKSGVSGDNLLQNSAMTPQRSIADAATTAGSTTLTSVTAAFTSADVGRTVCVTGAGGAVGAATVLTADIASVTDATTVELADAARNTVTGAAANIHDRDRDIAVLGGIWDRGAAVGNTGRLHGLNFRHVDTLTIDIDGYLSTQTGAKYAILLGSVEDVRVSVRRLDTVSDGLHINGPARRIEVPFLAGYTGDDMVSLTGADYPHYSDTAGDITDITVGTLHADGCAAGYKILAGQGNIIDRFKGGHFTGTTDSYAAWLGADKNYPDTMGGSYGTIDLGTIGVVVAGNAIVRIIDADASLVRVAPTGTSAGKVAVYVGENAGGVGVDVNMLSIADVSLTTGDLVRMAGSNSVVSRVEVERLAAVGDGLVVNAAAGVVGHLQVKDSRIEYTGAVGPFFSTGGQVNVLTLVDTDIVTTASTGVGPVVQKGAGGVGFPSITVTRGSVTGANSTRGLVAYNPSTLPVTLVLDNCNLVDLKRVADGVSAGLTVIMSNPRIKSALECFHVSAGGATITGSLGRLTTATNLFSAASAGTLRVNGATLPAKVGALTGLAGDIVKNTDATLGCGAGVVISNGTRWKHLYTGDTT